MPKNITCYRTKGQIKAFPKFNSSIFVLRSTKHEAIVALRKDTDFILWIQDQYMTKNIGRHDLADMLNIERHKIQNYIVKHKLFIRRLTNV